MASVSKPFVPSKPQRLSSFATKTMTPSKSAKIMSKGNRAVRLQRGNRDSGDGADEQQSASGEDVEAENNDETKSEAEEGNAGGDGEANAEQQSDETPPKKKKKPLHPQESIKKFWKNYDPEYQGHIVKVLPDPTPTDTTPKNKIQRSQNSSQSYEEARASCIRDVESIVRECEIANQKYTDPHFDIERDLKVARDRNHFMPLWGVGDGVTWSPADVKRVTDIFEDPAFYINGSDPDDIMQGQLGDCWFLAALMNIALNQQLLQKICVIQDQEVGVYGFVFYRDGEWHQTIIDDKLYLSAPSFDEDTEELLTKWGISQEDQEQKYEALFQKGSKALLFAKCRDQNETWVPLIEKAFAKAHGGYDAIDGGFSGEGLEDLTGGVTTEIYTSNILRKEKFWQELQLNGKDFLFGAGMANYKNWRAGWEVSSGELSWSPRRKGIIDHHAYSVIDTYEGEGVRLVKIRNPWGEGSNSEWKGRWSDGSKEWTPEWLQRLNYRFSEDGIFWISFEDFMKNYKAIERTRLFDKEWYTAQKWATVQVPFNTLDYQQTKFIVDVPEATETVFVLSQLDGRYFQGLQGKYEFTLHFRVAKEGSEGEYISRSRPLYNLSRSTNVELPLEAGRYTVLFKVEAEDFSPYGYKSAEEMIRQNMPQRKDKVLTLGRLYDLAHQKGLPELEETTSITENAEEAATAANNNKVAEPKVEEEQKGDSKNESTEETKTEDEASKPVADDSNDTLASIEADDDEEEEDEAKNPWNAVCVVGLRVYSKSSALSVGIVLPPKEENKQPVIDKDAITKAAQAEAEKDAAQGEKDAEKSTTVKKLPIRSGKKEDKEGKKKSSEARKEEETTKDEASEEDEDGVEDE